MSKGALNSLTIGLVRPFAEVKRPRSHRGLAVTLLVDPPWRRRGLHAVAQGGIRINTVSPGMTVTDMVSETAKTFDLGQIPLGRMVSARRTSFRNMPSTSVGLMSNMSCDVYRASAGHARRDRARDRVALLGRRVVRRRRQYTRGGRPAARDDHRVIDHR